MEIIPGAVLPSLFSLVRFLYVTVNKSVFLFPLSLYSFLWPTHSIFFLFVCLIVFQEDLCGHDRNIIETVDCQWEYNNSGDKYSMWLPKNHQFSLKENLRRIFSVVIDVFPFLCVRYDGKTKEAQFYCKIKWIYGSFSYTKWEKEIKKDKTAYKNDTLLL